MSLKLSRVKVLKAISVTKQLLTAREVSLEKHLKRASKAAAKFADFKRGHAALSISFSLTLTASVYRSSDSNSH